MSLPIIIQINVRRQASFIKINVHFFCTEYDFAITLKKAWHQNKTNFTWYCFSLLFSPFACLKLKQISCFPQKERENKIWLKNLLLICIKENLNHVPYNLAVREQNNRLCPLSG